jgi:branched-chain amino acid transport system ATP-binding protein
MAAAAPVPASSTAPLLELRDIDAGYGAFRALFGISLTLAPGAVLALLGSNGAGKTTIARVCSGLIAPTSGQVLFEGVDVTRSRPYKYAQLGIVHAPEGRSVFASLTVEENLELTFRRTRGRNGCRAALDEAYALFPRLGERRTQQAGTLSGGEQRMLSLSRVLVEKPRLLIADELSLGLAPLVVDEVYRTLETIRDSGTTLLLVEQHVHHALAIADEAIVLTKGEVAYSGPVSELGDLQSRVLGGTDDALPERSSRDPSASGSPASDR